jgi:hypothetical protein
MRLESTVTQEQTIDYDQEYPCLMQCCNGQIVMFHAPYCGMVVGCADGFSTPLQMGQYSRAWDMNKFTPFYGTVELIQTNKTGETHYE